MQGLFLQTISSLSMKLSVDVAIMGAGISGLSVADACTQRKKTCAVFDIYEPGKGTSGAPGMLVNAATGRRAKKAWRAEEGHQSIFSLLKRVKRFSDTEFFEQNNVLRPALTQKLADNFKRSVEKYDWPDGWIQWISKDVVNSDYPFVDNEFGALLIKNGLTVNGRIFLEECSNYLHSLGVQTFYNQTPNYYFKGGKWHITTDKGSKIVAEYVVDARGYALTRSKDWEFIPLHNIKGQTATFTFSEPLPLNSSISSLGYMAYLKETPCNLSVGSTYEHDFQSLETDLEGLNYLLKKLESTLPDYSKNYLSVKQWAGVRTTVPDRKPVIGPHPEITQLYVMGALGSKGLLLGRYVADELVGYIFEEQEIDREISSSRFFNQ